MAEKTLVHFSATEVYLKEKCRFNSHTSSLTIPIVDMQTKLKFNVIIIPQHKYQQESIQHLIENCKKIVGCKHRNILNVIEIYDKILTQNDIKHFKETENGKQFFNFTQSLIDKEESSMQVICIKTEMAIGISLTLWINLFQSTKQDPTYQQGQVIIIQNVVDGLKFLHNNGFYHGNLSTNSISLSQSQTVIPCPPAKINLVTTTHDISDPGKDLHQLGQIIQYVIRMSISPLLIPIAQFDALKKNPLIKNGNELIRRLTTEDQRYKSMQEVNIESNDNIAARVLSIMKDPDGTSWFEHLTFSECLGSGAFGMVLSAFDEKLKIMSAVKLILIKKEDSDPSSEEKQKREFQTMKDCRHINLANVLQFKEKKFGLTEIEELPEEENGMFPYLKVELQRNAQRSRIGVANVLCIEMELCGPTLRFWLDDNDRDTNSSLVINIQLRIISDLFTGLRYLHYKNIIHRDLKPANIFYTSQQQMFPLKIGDFGLSKHLHETDRKNDEMITRSLQKADCAELTEYVGTEVYMAPEVRSGKYGKQADIFSLGLIIWETLQSIDKKEKSILFNDLVYDENTSLIKDYPTIKNAKEIIIKMTKCDIEQRFGDMNDIHLIAPEIYATSADELTAYLKVFKAGSTIHLLEQEYCGYFVFNYSGVKLIGQGEKTILRNDGASPLAIPNDCNNCSISNLKIIGCGLNWFDSVLRVDGSQNVVHNVHIDNQYGKGDCLRIEGSENIVRQLRLENSEIGVLIEGGKSNNNLVDNIEIFNCKTGIRVSGFYPDTINNNSISNANFVNVQIGIDLMSAYDSNLGNICCKKNPGAAEKCVGVQMYWGSNTIIDNLVCEGYSMHNQDVGLKINNSKKCKICNSKCGPIKIGDMFCEDHVLMNVNGCELIHVTGKGNSLIKCVAETFVDMSDPYSYMEFFENDFKNIRPPRLYLHT